MVSANYTEDLAVIMMAVMMTIAMMTPLRMMTMMPVSVLAMMPVMIAMVTTINDYPIVMGIKITRL